LCPACGTVAMDLMYPPFAEPPPTGRHSGAEAVVDRIADHAVDPTIEQAVERTVVLPAVREGDP
jgi:hypothetical protein